MQLCPVLFADELYRCGTDIYTWCGKIHLCRCIGVYATRRHNPTPLFQVTREGRYSRRYTMSYTPLVCRTLSCRFEAGTHIGFMLKQPRQTQVGLDWRSDVPASRAEGKTCGARSGPVFSLYTSKSSPYTLGGGFVQSAVIIAHALRTVRRYTHISLSQSSRSPFWDP